MCTSHSAAGEIALIGLLSFHVIGLGRRLRIALWVWLGTDYEKSLTDLNGRLHHIHAERLFVDPTARRLQHHRRDGGARVGGAGQVAARIEGHAVGTRAGGGHGRELDLAAARIVDVRTWRSDLDGAIGGFTLMNDWVAPG